MDRDVTVRFYSIRPTDLEAQPLENVIRAVAGMAKPDREEEVAGSIVLRLEHLEERDGLLLGDLTRVQTENLPGHVTERDNDRLPVDRIGHPAAFCYDPEASCMALQFDIKIGVGRVCNYFQHFSRGNAFGHLPILRPDALERFQRETPTKFTVKIARRRNFEQAETQLTDFEAQIDAMGALFDAPSVEVSVSCRGVDGGLDQEGVLATLRRWLNFREEIDGVSKIGGETMESDEAYNFIKFLLREHERLDLPANDPLDGRQRRIAFVRSRYARHRAYLREHAGVR